MADYIQTDRTPELFDFMIISLGKSIYSHYNDDNLIMFNFITHNWFTSNTDYSTNKLSLTNEEFKYFMELKTLGLVLTESLVLTYLNQEKKG